MVIFDGPGKFFKNRLNVIYFSWAIHRSQESIENRVQLILLGGVHVEDQLSRNFTFKLFKTF